MKRHDRADDPRPAPRLAGFGERITSIARWEDLKLAAAEQQRLREIVGRIRHGEILAEQIARSAETFRRPSASALLTGPNDQGKRLAAQAIASDLNFDLYRIDLRSVSSKYIGETEKNLSRIFDAAQLRDIVLYFDEADALFGKRSEVKDAHDRYANLAAAFFLERMESFPGVVILTTNVRDSIDAAFARRIDFIIHFGPPGDSERAGRFDIKAPRKSAVGSKPRDGK